MVTGLRELELVQFIRNYFSGELKWETKDGKVISVKDMSDEHLSNAINLLRKHEMEEEQYFDALSSYDGW